MAIERKYHFPLYMLLAGIIPILIGTILFEYSESGDMLITGVFVGTGFISIIPFFSATLSLCFIISRINNKNNTHSISRQSITFYEIDRKFAIKYIFVTLVMLGGFVLMFYSIVFYEHAFWWFNICAFVLGILCIYSAMSEFHIFPTSLSYTGRVLYTFVSRR